MVHAAFQPLNFSDLPEWAGEQHLAAFNCFLRSAAIFTGDLGPKTRRCGVDGAALGKIFATARASADSIQDDLAARRFFESHFVPVAVADGTTPAMQYPGLLTAYYEPEVEGSLTPSQAFPVPLLRRPPDLVEVKSMAAAADGPSTLPSDWPPDLRFGRIGTQGLVPYYDRGEIEGFEGADGALADRGLELVWLADRVEAFFIHIQGSASIRLQQGGTMRVSYDGKSGHAYTAIGKVLKDSGLLPSGGITMQTIKAWLRAHPDRQSDILHSNRSFIFFRKETDLLPELGPRAAAGVQLTQGRSLAVDRLLHTFHTPVFVHYRKDDRDHARLMIAQDTGSAIVGAHRGDFFCGSGDQAADHAGGFAAPCSFTVLLPRLQLGASA
uniref:murein transglycosylase A n=1 Tax=Pararhizobium sp. IMCC3301 TaxID=3067904 RepID=UPI0027424B1E|nr:MltA domain-containing protein [Pararhizobium sp. IMCC3301]